MVLQHNDELQALKFSFQAPDKAEQDDLGQEDAEGCFHLIAALDQNGDPSSISKVP